MIVRLRRWLAGVTPADVLAESVRVAELEIRAAMRDGHGQVRRI